MKWLESAYRKVADTTLVDVEIGGEPGAWYVHGTQAQYGDETSTLFYEPGIPDLDTAKRRAAALYADILRAELARVRKG